MAEPARPAGRAELAARRVIAVGVAVLVLVTGGLVAVLMMREGDRSLPVWYFAVALVVVGCGVATGVLAPWLPARALRVGGAGVVTGYLLLLAAFLPAQALAPDLGRIPWMLSAGGAAVGAALLVGGRRLAWSVLAVAVVAATGYRLLVGGLDLDGIVNDVQTTLTGAVICVIGAHVLSVSRGLDAAAESAASATRLASAERGRLAARTRAAALVHDEVLATLSLAGSELPVPRDRLATQAEGATTMIASMAHEDPPSLPLLETLAEEAARAGAAFAVVGDVEPAIDDAARESLAAATRQALQNSLRHAGACARAVTLRRHAAGIEVEIVDDGRGFDPDAVSPDRLGIRRSIVGRMRDVAGGSARVDSAAGAGTRVRLEWSPPPPADVDLAGDRRGLERGLAAIAVLFVLGQTLCAVLAAVVTPAWWVPLLVLAGVLFTAEVLRRSMTSRPSLARTAGVVALTVGVVSASIAAVPFTFGTTWFVSSAGFLLVALSLRGRIRVSLLALASIVAVVAAAGVSVGAAPAQIGYVTARPIVLVVLAVLLLVAVERMQRRSTALHRRSTAAAEQAAWDAAARAELARRAAQIAEAVLPLLRRIASTTPLTDADRRGFLAVEGRLRDEYRAGALVREPLTAAAQAARERGVDVVLFDDRDTAMRDSDVDEIARWMAERIRPAARRVVGRLPPEGRGHVATVTVDGETTGFGG